jgi:hypothetical protein
MTTNRWMRWISLFALALFLLARAAPALAAADTINLKVANKTGVAVTLVLRGPQYYALQVKTGNSTHKIAKGTYNWNFVAYGLTKTGTLKATGGSAELTLDKMTASLKVNNKAGDAISFRLSGPKGYTFTLKAGNNKLDVLTGTYSYSYFACGKTNTGKIEVKSKGAELRLDDCGGGSSGSGDAKVVVNNRTGGALTLRLSGPQSYSWTIPPGKTTFKVISGTYSFTAYGCGGASKSGSVKIKGTYQWDWWCG